MSELLPTLQAEDVRDGLIDYLTTTFALADDEARESLTEFLRHPDHGIFKGPYVRLRLPYRPADHGWEQSLEWWPEGFTPYGHQAAAFQRLSSANLGTEKPRPLPTLVTTGTGSGKTEAFLFPILDHVLRAKREGITGTKALILYPMNALANDQARRLADLITTDPRLSGVRAGIYTGQDGPTRSTVTKDGLITSRDAMQDDAPDILLTNYKMLDQLLLRPADQTLWKQSATSLRYLVLDEFHTYDGAQGTDVAMLLRRLGMALKRHWKEGDRVTADDWGRPLGMITPIATSATLGDKGDPGVMVGFANTVFGDEFTPDSVVTETRLSLDEWVGDAPAAVESHALAERPLTPTAIAQLNAAAKVPDGAQRDASVLARDMLAQLFTEQGDDGEPFDATKLSDAELFDLARGHSLVQAICQAATEAVSLDDLANAVFSAGLNVDETLQDRDAARQELLVNVIAMLSHIRKEIGRAAASVDLHLWVRALTRVDRVAGPTAAYRWSDDGAIEIHSNDDPESDSGREVFPAIYCRHCGRSGWGIQLAPVGTDLDTNDETIRRNHAAKEGRFRALIYAPREADHNELRLAEGKPAIEGLHWFDVNQRRVSMGRPEDTSAGPDTSVLPVLALSGEDADDDSRHDKCPNCQQNNGIRFLGSAIATLLSVSITTIFGDRNLDNDEKKALVFTDSVQDAAHRAGFIQSRSHVFSMRNAMRQALGGEPATLEDLAEALMAKAKTNFDRYRLLSPEIVDRQEFQPYWLAETAEKVPAAVRRRVRARLAFDLALEFGLQSDVGRTLEITGAASAEVDAGSASALESFGRAAVKDYSVAGTLDAIDGSVQTSDIVRWVRGVLERMRHRGAIHHEFLDKYIQNNGERYWVWGGRPRGRGMPAFPGDREAPAFPRFGPVATTKAGRTSNFDQAASAQSWYSRWASRVLNVPPSDGAKLSRLLFDELDRAGILAHWPTGTNGASVYGIMPSRILVTPIGDDHLVEVRTRLECDTCQASTAASESVIAQLMNGPCLANRCTGTLHPATSEFSNYYRGMYTSGDMRRVVAREHTSLLPDKTRLAYEKGFKQSASEPDAPNVLVATPTLEMGIDIGDLSAVFLAGLPRSVASYLQRIGRAGRLTGNSLSMAFVLGRGEQLPKLGDPLSVINGAVRPPATYLNAEEILRRQYTASVIDRLAAEGKVIDVQWAKDVLESTEDGSFLATVIADAETRAADHLDAFLAAFDQVDERTANTLRVWATPGEEARSSDLATTLIAASQRWNQDMETLWLRQKAITDSLDGLIAADKAPAATDEDHAALRSARTSQRMLKRQISDLSTEHWVGSLERFGVLPNYTLLDDQVRLDVALSWQDPETNEFQHDEAAYDRASGIAIHELAPGATFYAQGVEILIDAVDLGRDGTNVRPWILCAACGYAHEVITGQPKPAVCPRCLNSAIADTHQQFDIVELEQVSAEVRRDESSIGDASDDRRRERFTVQVAADIDPSKVIDQWYVEGTSFGIKYLREVTVRWFNLGRAASNGPDRTIAGAEHRPALFRVCDACGKLDQIGDANTPNEHRAWCPNRKSRAEHVRTIALSRTLATQGIVFSLPTAITIGDSLATPSLSAALQLGLREVIGGDPDHLRVATIIEPDPESGGTLNPTALLIHDAVPGGTGYLADLAEEDNIREVLMLAWQKVRDCPCQNEERAACDKCLLPFAPGNDIGAVSRASAYRTLGLLLGVDDGEPTPWVTTSIPQGAADPESHLEQWFRKAFKERADALGATVKEIPGTWGNKIQLKLPHSNHVWVLTPQVNIGPTRPDFVLESMGGGATPVAIYTDGYSYHASPGNNRLKDDATKRRYLRDHGYHVMAITWSDIQRATNGDEEPARPWLALDAITDIAAAFQLPPAALDHLTANPMTLLMEWIQNPDGAEPRWTKAADALPMLVRPRADTAPAVDSAEHLSSRAAAVLDGQAVDGSPDAETWQWTAPHLVLLARRKGVAIETVLMIDDRNAAVESHGYDVAWKTWLGLSNLLAPRDISLFTSITTRSLVDSGEVASAPSDAAVPEIEPAWAETIEFASAEERELLVALSAVDGLPVPAVGEEIGDGIPVALAWVAEQVAVGTDLSEADVEQLENLGWTVVEASVDAILNAVKAGE